MKEQKQENKKQKTVEVAFVALLLFVCAPVFAQADTTTVINNVSSSANSGGNTSVNGQTVEGKTTNTTSVYTEINGEVVENYTETSEEPIHYSNTVSTSESSTTVSVSTSAHAGTATAATKTETTAASEVSAQQNATHERAPEITDTLQDENSSGDEQNELSATTSGQIAVAAESDAGLSDQGVATRVVVAVRSFISKIISFFW